MPPKKSRNVQRLGATIRIVRAEHGYSQEGFAAQSGIDRSYFGAIERGEFNVSFDTLVRIAHGLGTTAEFICARAKL